MSHRISLAAAAALIGLAVSAAPAFAVMQVIQLPDPTAASQNTSAPDGLFDKSFSDQWHGHSSDSQSGLSSFHFTMSGSGGGYSSAGTANSSAVESSKQPGSEFYQPLPGTSFPDYNH
jgi:hypothetical protein